MPIQRYLCVCVCDPPASLSHNSDGQSIPITTWMSKLTRSMACLLLRAKFCKMAVKNASPRQQGLVCVYVYLSVSPRQSDNWSTLVVYGMAYSPESDDSIQWPKFAVSAAQPCKKIPQISGKERFAPNFALRHLQLQGLKKCNSIPRAQAES